MVLGCAIWLGRGASIQYLTSITSFILKNAEDTKVSLFYSKSKFNLPENFKELYQEFQEQHDSLLPEYEVFIDRIDFCDIDTVFENDKYIAWLDQFEPTPYAFISDYLRFAILLKLVVNGKYHNDLIAFFELDVQFKALIPDDGFCDTLTLPEDESALFFILVNKPQQHSQILLANVVKVYTELYQKILSNLDIKNNPHSLDILENESYVVRALGFDSDLPEENESDSVDISSGYVNLRGFYKVIQGLAKESMMDDYETIGAKYVLSEMDVTELMEHFPSSIESIYEKKAYKLKAESAATSRPSVEKTASHSQQHEPSKIIKSSRSMFFDETLHVSKRTKTVSDSSEVVNEEGPPF